MKTTLFALVAPFLTLALIPTARASDLSKQIEPLVKQSQAARPACEEFKKSLAAAVPGHDLNGTPLPDRASFLRVLAIVSKYPGPPDATRKVYAKVAAAAENGELDDEAIQAEMGAYGCEGLKYYDAARTLIVSAHALPLPAKDRVAVATLVLGDIGAQLGDADTLIAALLEGELLTTLIDERVIDASDAIFTESIRWNEEMGQIRGHQRELSRRHPTSVETIGAEFKSVRVPIATLKRLARRLMPAPASG